MINNKFKTNKITSEAGFWTMFYFLKEHYDLSGGTFGLTDILSVCEPSIYTENDKKTPTDSAMIAYWNEALEKYKAEGIPELKTINNSGQTH